MSNNISNFIKKSPLENITAASIIYKMLEINSTIVKEELLQLMNTIINNVKNEINSTSNLYIKLCNIPTQVSYFYLIF
jgi:hypothetical protein